MSSSSKKSGTSSKPSVLSPGAQLVVKSLDKPLESPLCARAYVIALSSCMSRVESAVDQNDTSVLDLIQHSLMLLIHLTDMGAPLERKLFEGPCHCAVFPEFLPMHVPAKTASRSDPAGFMPTSMRLRCQENRYVAQPLDFFEIMADVLDVVISKISQGSSPKCRAWIRTLSSFINTHSQDLTRMMDIWLRRSQSFMTYAFFGTLLGVNSYALVTAMEANPTVVLAFDERLHALLESHLEDRQIPDPVWQPLDLVYHGAGFFAQAIHKNLWPSQTRSRFATLMKKNAQKRFEDLVRLLELSPKASKGVQSGKALDLIFIADLVESLATLLLKPLPPIVSKIFSPQKRDSEAHALGTMFKSYTAMSDRCHNPRCPSEPETPSELPTEVSILSSFRDYVPKGERLRRCPACRCAYYCGTECQTDDWKNSKPTHKSMCKVLERFESIMESNEYGQGYEGMKKHISAVENIPSKDRSLLVDYLFQRLSHIGMRANQVDWEGLATKEM